MPRYSIVGVQTKEEPVGFSVLNDEKLQLETVHILDYWEAKEMLDRLEKAALITENWPDPDDPEVVALINDQSFEPKGQINLDVLTSPVYRLHMAAETIARRRAGLDDTPDSLEGKQRG